METKVSTAFVKLERDKDGQTIAWHPLVDHLIDVAACFVRLCRCRSIQRPLERAARRNLDPQDIARLAVLVFLHDLGKANSGFQAKRWPKGELPKGWPKPAGHGWEALDLSKDEAFLQPLVALLPVAEIEDWGDAVLPLFRASISHHDRPLFERPPGDWPRANWKPVIAVNKQVVYDPAPVLEHIGQQARMLFPMAFALGGKPLPDAPAFSHLFAGLVQLADWLGSDTAFFRLSNGIGDRACCASDYADKAVASLGMDTDAWRINLNLRKVQFNQIFGDPPGNQLYPIQR